MTHPAHDTAAPPPGAPPPAVIEPYRAGLAAYREGRFDAAAGHFRTALRAAPDDGPARALLDRCLAFADNPPTDGWTGEHVLTER